MQSGFKSILVSLNFKLLWRELWSSKQLLDWHKITIKDLFDLLQFNLCLSVIQGTDTVAKLDLST